MSCKDIIGVYKYFLEAEFIAQFDLDIVLPFIYY